MGVHRGIVLLLAIVLAGLFAPGCRDYRVQEVAPLPTRVEVEGPEQLRAVVTDMKKRPLAGSELAQFHRAGVRWDYTVRFTSTAQSGVLLEQVENRLKSLTGATALQTVQLPPSRVEPGGTTPITVHAELSSSNPSQRGELQGVQELTFRGRDDAGQPVRVVVRVPLD
jgi:hypothetical protein